MVNEGDNPASWFNTCQTESRFQANTLLQKEKILPQ
jgi:hypothetical protein